MTSGKLILVVSRIWKVPARHGDVPSAYVKADKEAELVIMLHIPEGMVISDALLRLLGVTDKRELALLLKKGMYGHKQSGRLWNLLLHTILLSLGFIQCYTDTCMYDKIEVDGTTLVGVYEDALLDLGVVSKFLGTTFKYDDVSGWELDQEQVIQEML
ncbi:hypothetical protein PR002_g20384 [Phytophthora rubi]|uniref:Reverse transcriptase Ty1/copia-type domain-containing protein n=1 Tax=Phytophthora rubi TaxID=129364 RepID=A0A6A3JFK5_9STRA|nr:hypothetical protein PR002_g20384 [Phytophthora rubi]